MLLAAGGDSNGPSRSRRGWPATAPGSSTSARPSLDLPWNAYYDKELDVRFSRSYGPGRYDDRYELEGIDYPAGYVRWTERRNLACFLDLLAERRRSTSTPLVSGVPRSSEAADGLRRLASGDAAPASGSCFEYPARTTTVGARPRRTDTRPARAARRGARRRATGALRVGFIGAGNYASSMLLPHLRDARRASTSSRSRRRRRSPAVNAQRKFGFRTSRPTRTPSSTTTTLDAVFVVTRHDSHAALVCRALERGKAVFVEKPLALTDGAARRRPRRRRGTGNDRLMVGFNRRFAPLVIDLRAARVRRPHDGPVTARYLVNAGQLAAGSWYLNEELEGSRFTGEGGHFIDTLSALVGDPPGRGLRGAAPGPTCTSTLRFADGSVGTIAYVTSGSTRFPKETLDVAADGRNGRLDNFRRVTVWTGPGKTSSGRSLRQDKGQRAQLARFVDAVRTGAADADPAGLARRDDPRHARRRHEPGDRAAR